MTPEFLSLFATTALLLFIPYIYGSILTLKLGVGPTILSNRESFPKLEGAFGRAQRAHLNLLENIVPFAVAVFMVRFLGVSNWWTVTGAYLFLGARSVHAFSYIAGIVGVRSLAYNIGLFATVMVASQCF